MEITPRQSFILRKVVEAHVNLDQPVGSKWLADQQDVPWGPSTVRAELARLEDFGLLEHLREGSGREDLYKLGGPLGLELDDLLPVTEAAKQLGLVKIASGEPPVRRTCSCT